MKTPTRSQERVRDHESLALRLVAPAGCGKTEALAIRVRGLIDSGRIARPQRILLTTFTNRAKDNIHGRLRDYLSAPMQRDHVTISNFHGLAIRLLRAHGAVIGIDPKMEMPDRDWVRERCFGLGANYGGKDVVQKIFAEIKQKALDDRAVAVELAARDNKLAIQIEEERLAANRATYDDLLRYAELILANDAVAELYRHHFGAIIVDEYQDLTPQQLRVMQRLGTGNITFAGDLAQGIYGFAGAQPVEIDESVRRRCDETVRFNESHRSSPAVLEMVNSMNPYTGGETLTCATPTDWPAGGLAGRVTFPHAQGEAAWVNNIVRSILNFAPNQRVAVMSRVKSRLRFVEQRLDVGDIDIHRWEDGVLDTETAAIVRSTLARLNMHELERVEDKISFLRDLANISDLQDPDTQRSLADALTWVLGRFEDGLSPDDVSARIRIGDQSTLLDVPGIHLLSGHVGKGQQFDWVFLVGVEDGNIPFFRAKSEGEIEEEARVLGVMLSRARYGVVLTYSEVVPTMNGFDKDRPLSRFWSALDPAQPFDREEVGDWLKSAPWHEFRSE